MYLVHEVPLYVVRTYSVTQPLQLRSDCGDKGPPNVSANASVSGNTLPLLRGSAAPPERVFEGTTLRFAIFT
jgi:hypothetical protein